MRGKGEERSREEGETEGGTLAGGGGQAHRGEKRPALAPSLVQSYWVIKGKKNEPLYLSGAGQESSAAVIKILSSPVKDTYRSSSATRSLFVKENQLNRWGLSFHSSCKRARDCLLAASKLVWGLTGHPQYGRRGTRDLCAHERDGSPAAGNVWVAGVAAPGGYGARDDTLQSSPGPLNRKPFGRCSAAWPRGQGGI